MDSSKGKVEFFDLGGDPRERGFDFKDALRTSGWTLTRFPLCRAVMAYMVKNPGLMPGFESLTNGDIGKKKKMLTEVSAARLRSCLSVGLQPALTACGTLLIRS